MTHTDTTITTTNAARHTCTQRWCDCHSLSAPWCSVNGGCDCQASRRFDADGFRIGHDGQDRYNDGFTRYE